MSYVPEKRGGGGGRAAAGGGGCVFMIVIAIGGFILLSRMNAGGGDGVPDQRPTANENSRNDDPINRDGGIVFDPPERTAAPEHEDAGDWAMSDAGATETGRNGSVRRNGSGDSTTNGDWTMEQPETRSGTRENDQVEIRLGSESQPVDSSAEPGWTLEDVEPKRPPTSTRNGDWELEEVPAGGGSGDR